MVRDFTLDDDPTHYAVKCHIIGRSESRRVRKIHSQVFLHDGGRHIPGTFARSDFNRTQLGHTSQAVRVLFIPGQTMFLDGRTPTKYGRLVSWEDDPFKKSSLPSKLGPYKRATTPAKKLVGKTTAPNKVKPKASFKKNVPTEKIAQQENGAAQLLVAWMWSNILEFGEETYSYFWRFFRRDAAKYLHSFTNAPENYCAGFRASSALIAPF